MNSSNSAKNNVPPKRTSLEPTVRNAKPPAGKRGGSAKPLAQS